MQALQDRMKYLRRGEALAIVGLPTVFVWSWLGDATDASWNLRVASLALVCFILLQGVLYWHLKLQSIDQRKPLPAYFSGLFRSFQVFNMVAIAAILVAMFWPGAVKEDVEWAYWLMALAILEQINYYHYQLMYDARGALAHAWRNGRLRKAALALDLARGR